MANTLTAQDRQTLMAAAEVAVSHPTQQAETLGRALRSVVDGRTTPSAALAAQVDEFLMTLRAQTSPDFWLPPIGEDENLLSADMAAINAMVDLRQAEAAAVAAASTVLSRATTPTTVDVVTADLTAAAGR